MSSRKNFATRKQEVQSLYLAGYSEDQISTVTGVHRRNINRYVRCSAVPRALPRQLTGEELHSYNTQVGAPMSFSLSATPTYQANCMRILKHAEDTIQDQKQKLDEEGIDTPVGEDVEHYYDRVWKRLKQGDTTE